MLVPVPLCLIIYFAAYQFYPPPGCQIGSLVLDLIASPIVNTSLWEREFDPVMDHYFCLLILALFLQQKKGNILDDVLSQGDMIMPPRVLSLPAAVVYLLP